MTNTADGRLHTLRALLVALPHSQRRLKVVLPLMLCSAALEVMTVGAAVPFFGYLIRESATAGATTSSAPAPTASLIEGAALLLTIALIAGVVRLVTNRLTSQYAFSLGHEISDGAFSALINQSYSEFAARNPAEITSGLERVHPVIFNALIPLLNGAVALVVGTAIAVALLFIAPLLMLTACLLIACSYALVFASLRSKLARLSRANVGAAVQRSKIIQSAVGGFRDIQMDRTHDLFRAKFADADAELRGAQADSSFYAAAPRYLIDLLLIVLFCGATVVAGLSRTNLIDFLPVLGAVALGAQRAAPQFHSAYSGWALYSVNHRTLQLLLDIVEAGRRSPNPAGAISPKFMHSVKLRDVTIRFDGRHPILSNVNIEIHKGDWVALWGETGVGKSSLLDILMGLTTPTSGVILIDDIALAAEIDVGWRTCIAHVSQEVYLADGTIRDNITVGSGYVAFDMLQFERACRTAQIAEWIESLPEGYDTSIGERGVQISGGQRQRIALARALYRNPNLLVLDEATSALDQETEAVVATALKYAYPHLTLVAVTHRAGILDHFDRILKIENGTVK